MNNEKALGGHPNLAKTVLCKTEVAALLCKEGISRGYWCIPEYRINTTSGTRNIDVVWAERNSDGVNGIWKLIAAFEIEGHDCYTDKKALPKDFESLSAARKEGAESCAVVLFQASVVGELWHPTKFNNNFLEITQNRLNKCSANEKFEIVTDEILPEYLRKIR